MRHVSHRRERSESRRLGVCPGDSGHSPPGGRRNLPILCPSAHDLRRREPDRELNGMFQERFLTADNRFISDIGKAHQSGVDHTPPWCGGTCRRSQSSESPLPSPPESRSSRVVSGSTSPKMRASRARSIRARLGDGDAGCSAALPAEGPLDSSSEIVLLLHSREFLDHVGRQRQQRRHAVADRGARRRQIGDERRPGHAHQSARQTGFHIAGSEP